VVVGLRAKSRASSSGSREALSSSPLVTSWTMSCVDRSRHHSTTSGALSTLMNVQGECLFVDDRTRRVLAS